MAINFPDSPTNGQVFTSGSQSWTYYTTPGVWKVTSGAIGYTGSKGTTYIADTSPVSPVNGDTWFDSEEGIRYVYYADGTSNQWIQESTIGPRGYPGYTGSIGVGSQGYTGSIGPIAGSNTQLIYNNSGIAAGANVFFNNTNGNVGVGTSSPGVLFDVNGVGRFGELASKISVGLNGDSISMNGDLYVQTSTANPLILRTNFAEVMRLTGVGNVGIGTSSPATRLDLNGASVTNVVAVAASAVDCMTGNYFTKTVTGALTWTVTNVPANRAYSFLLELTNGGTGTQTWYTGTKWPGGTAPTLTASGVDVLGFITDDGGTNWRGVLLMKDSK